MSMLIDAYRFGGGGGGGGGATPTLLSRTASSFASNTTSHLVSMPATVTVGDLLVCLIGIGNNSATITTPSGWTAGATEASDGASKAFLFYKVASGTEGGTTVNFVTSAGIRAAAQVFRFQAGTYSGTPEIAFSENPPGTPNANPDPPNLAPSWGSANTYWLIFCTVNSSPTVSVYPGSSGVITTANTASIASCYDTTPGASLNPGAFTISASLRWVAGVVAIRPG